jgi:trigger factor
VVVKEVKKKRVPALDNDFARSAGECETVPSLREKVKKDLLAHKEREQAGRLKDQILDKLLAVHPFDAPESLVDAETEDMLENLRRSLAGRGLTAAQLEEEMARGHAKATDLARKRVRSSLVLEAVADQEPTAFNEMMKREGRIEGMRRRLLERKALDFLYQRANVGEGVNLVTLA